jgi:hypothetical protein
MVWIKRDLEALDLAYSLELFFHLLMLYVLWNASYEHVVSDQLLSVVTKQGLVKLESTAWLTIDVEVSHCIACLLKLKLVINADYGSVKWPGNITLNLRLQIQLYTSLLDEDLSKLLGADLVLWQII